MSNIWVYGDSFVRDWGLDWQWHHSLGEFSNRNVHIKGDFGVANDWILMQFAEDFAEGNTYSKGDVVIIVTTSCNRYWFLKDHPTISNYSNLTMFENYKNKYGVTDEQVAAIDLYFKHIHQGYIDAFRFDAHVAWLNHMSRELDRQGVRLCVIPGWDNFSYVKLDCRIPVKGNLVDSISSQEFTSEKAMDQWYGRSLPDQRVNHMLLDNHYELAKQIARAITEDTVLDLDAVEWKKGVLNLRTEQIFANQLSPVTIR